jgi:DNA polymerase-1
LGGEDIHARTAAEVFGVSIDNITPDLRRKAKAVNFGIVYGISDYGLSKDLRIFRKEAAEYISLYFARYPKVENFLDDTVKTAHEKGYVTTMFGRRRFLPMIKSPNFHQRGLAERMAMNTPIQGTAADIIKIAMINAEKDLRGLQSQIILQVHDELVIETTENELAQVEKIVRAAMENVATLKVPLVVDVHFGKNWAEAK